ncbi:MAG: hypothetical protein M1825_003230 [Sarcosagium campestre]|nr:MAG: hypothetical protein M1825_003230 [Sarcosagium campestre]
MHQHTSPYSPLLTLILLLSSLAGTTKSLPTIHFYPSESDTHTSIVIRDIEDGACASPRANGGRFARMEVHNLPPRADYYVYSEPLLYGGWRPESPYHAVTTACDVDRVYVHGSATGENPLYIKTSPWTVLPKKKFSGFIWWPYIAPRRDNWPGGGWYPTETETETETDTGSEDDDDDGDDDGGGGGGGGDDDRGELNARPDLPPPRFGRSGISNLIHRRDVAKDIDGGDVAVGRDTAETLRQTQHQHRHRSRRACVHENMIIANGTEYILHGDISQAVWLDQSGNSMPEDARSFLQLS